MIKYDLDEYNRHSIYLERLASGGINSVVVPSLEDTYRAIAAILGEYDQIENKAQLNAIMKAIKEAVDDNSGWIKLTQEDLQPLALYEASWQANYAEEMTGLSTKVPAERTILGFINTALMSLQSGQRSDVGLWQDFVKANVDTRSEQINNVVQRGFMRGETVASMRKEIKTLSDGMLRREAEALARTGYVHYAAQATEAMIQQNKDVVDEYYYVVTFDSRTSDRCIGVSKLNQPKNRLKVGDPKAPQPPLHFNAVAGGEVVNTESGYKSIENVAVGEKVWTHKGRLKPVTAVMKKSNDTRFVRVIRCDTGNVIRVTDEHPVLVDGRGWIRADEVKVGDRVFQKYSSKRPVVNGLPVTKGNPHNYPSMFDGEEVFFEVELKSGSMASTINLDDNFMLNGCKIPNGVAKNKLPLKLNWLRAKEVIKGLFTFNFNIFKSLFEGLNSLGVKLINSHRVFSGHSNGVRHVGSAGFLCFAKRPMIFSNTNASGNPLFGGNSCGVRPAKGLNSVNPAPSAHGAVSKVKFSLNFSKGFAALKVMGFKEAYKRLFGAKIKDGCHFCSPIVTSISIVEYKEDVYNLEVKDDHTYMVNDIIVHNCRTRRLAVPEGFTFEGTKAAVGGKKGEEAAKRFAERDRRRRKASQVRYRGKKDSDIFKPGQVDANLTYDQWLKQQPRWFIDDTLGPKRAKLWLDDGVSLTKFSDMLGNPLTLAEIMKREGKS